MAVRETKIQKGIFGKTIGYSLYESPRAKWIRLEVHRSGIVKLIVPMGISQARTLRFLNKKSDWLIRKLNFFKTYNGPFRKAARRGGKRDYIKYKEKARRLVLERLVYFNKVYNFKYNRVSIRNQKSRWGSCSKRGNLNFNYRIAFLPSPLADYIIVHELCHLGELNHSKAFWDLVKRACPEHRRFRVELRKGGFPQPGLM